MAGEAQILAHRWNARKSTAPQTLPMSPGLATAKRFAKTSAQRNCFMQNKPNFFKAKINVNLYLQKDYENISRRGFRKNKTNQTQFQNTTPKEREEKKVSGKLLKKQFYFFLVANRANPALYSENTPVRDA